MRTLGRMRAFPGEAGKTIVASAMPHGRGKPRPYCRGRRPRRPARRRRKIPSPGRAACPQAAAARSAKSPPVRGGGQAKPGRRGNAVRMYPSVKNQIDFCQFAAANPVAALTAHWAVIHYRDCASLTPERGAFGRIAMGIAIAPTDPPGRAAFARGRYGVSLFGHTIPRP